MQPLTPERAAKLIAAAGARYLGVQQEAVWIHDPVTQSTLALPLAGLTLRRLTAALHRTRKKFALSRRCAARAEAARARRSRARALGAT